MLSTLLFSALFVLVSLVSAIPSLIIILLNC